MKLTLKSKLSYASGDFAYCLVYAFLNAFILTFLTEVVKMPVKTAGMLTLCANVFDAISDPIVGHIADRHKGRYGRYKPWILIATVPAALLLFLNFCMPEVSMTRRIVYAWAAYLVWTVAKTCVQIPYSAMAATLTDSSEERVSLGAVRDWMSNLGGLIVSVAAVRLVGYFGEDNITGYRYAAAAISVISVVCYYISACGSKERFYVEEHLEPEGGLQAGEKASLLRSLTAVFTTRSALALIGFVLMGQLAMGIRNSLGTYYCIYYLGDTKLSVLSVTMALCYALPLIGILMVPKLVRRLGRRSVMMLGAGLLVLAGALSLLARKNFLMADLSGACVGVALCFQMSIVWGAMPDVADDIFQKKGVQATGFFSAILSLGMAVGVGLCGFIASRVLDFAGYSSEVTVQAPGVGVHIYWFYGAFQILTGLLMLLCAAKFKLKGTKA